MYLFFAAQKVVSNLSSLTSQVRPADVVNTHAVRSAMQVDVPQMQEHIRAAREKQRQMTSSSSSSSGSESANEDAVSAADDQSQPATESINPMNVESEDVATRPTSNLDETEAAVLGIL